MALLSFTCASLKNFAAQAMGKQVPSNGNSLIDIVNRAQEFIANYHTWRWRLTFASLALTNATGTVDLPTDFGELASIVCANTYSAYRIRAVSPMQLDLMRVFATPLAAAPNGTMFGYVIAGKTQSAVTAVPLRQLRLSPLPGLTTDATGLSISYYKLLPTLSADTDMTEIPAGMFEAIVQAVRCFATSTEEIAAPENSPNWALCKQILDAYKAVDDRVMPSVSVLDDVITDYYDAGARIRPFGS